MMTYKVFVKDRAVRKRAAILDRDYNTYNSGQKYRHMFCFDLTGLHMQNFTSTKTEGEAKFYIINRMDGEIVNSDFAHKMTILIKNVFQYPIMFLCDCGSPNCFHAKVIFDFCTMKGFSFDNQISQETKETYLRYMDRKEGEA